MAATVALERVETEARQIHLLWHAAAIQDRKNVTQLLPMRRRHTAIRPSAIQGFEPAMAEGSDHALV